MLTQAGCLSRLSYAATYALRTSVSEIGPGIASDHEAQARKLSCTWVAILENSRRDRARLRRGDDVHGRRQRCIIWSYLSLLLSGPVSYGGSDTST